MRCRLMPVVERPRVLQGALSRLMDRSGTVRRRALDVLAAAIQAHPFSVDGGILRRSLFEQRLEQLQVAVEAAEKDEERRQSSMSRGEAIDQEQQSMQSQASRLLLERQLRYYTDALAFVELLEGALRQCSYLLSLGAATANSGTSTTVAVVSKTEICEISDFVVVMHTFGVEAAQDAIRALLPLYSLFDTKVVGTTAKQIQEDPSDDVDSSPRSRVDVKEYLITKFRLLLLTPSDVKGQGLREQAAEIVTRLVAFASGLNVAEFGCLVGVLKEAANGLLGGTSSNQLLKAIIECLIVNLRKIRGGKSPAQVSNSAAMMPVVMAAVLAALSERTPTLSSPHEDTVITQLLIESLPSILQTRLCHFDDYDEDENASRVADSEAISNGVEAQVSLFVVRALKSTLRRAGACLDWEDQLLSEILTKNLVLAHCNSPAWYATREYIIFCLGMASFLRSFVSFTKASRQVLKGIPKSWYEGCSLFHSCILRPA